jgi:hypothetical protein
VYDKPPLGLRVKLWPAQIVPPLTETVGETSTVILDTADAVLTQPAELVPITEYEAFDVGVTTADPLEYEYVLAPLGSMVKLWPLQMLPLLTEITGIALTVTVTTVGPVLTQPAELVPVTEYEVVEAGVTTGVPLE